MSDCSEVRAKEAAWALTHDDMKGALEKIHDCIDETNYRQDPQAFIESIAKKLSQSSPIQIDLQFISYSAAITSAVSESTVTNKDH